MCPMTNRINGLLSVGHVSGSQFSGPFPILPTTKIVIRLDPVSEYLCISIFNLNRSSSDKRVVFGHKIVDRLKGRVTIRPCSLSTVLWLTRPDPKSICFLPYDFLLCNSNYVFKTRRFFRYSTSKMSWPWNPCQISLKVIESGKIR